MTRRILLVDPQLAEKQPKGKQPKHRKDKNISTMFRIPNTPEGKAFIKQMRQYAVAGTRIIVRGRGPRRPASIAMYGGTRTSLSLRQSIPQAFAESFAIYVRKESND